MAIAPLRVLSEDNPVSPLIYLPYFIDNTNLSTVLSDPQVSHLLEQLIQM